jgi:hypothetical protein
MTREWASPEYQNQAPQGRFEECHFTVAQIGEMWTLSADVVRRLFEREPGVLVIADDALKRGKRRYRTLRIPHSVAERVHRRLSNPTLTPARARA